MSAPILIVEDDKVRGRFLDRVLTRAGYAVVLVTDPDQALPLARLHRPLAALLDLGLRGTKEGELARQRRGEFPDLALILMPAFPLRLGEHPKFADLFPVSWSSLWNWGFCGMESTRPDSRLEAEWV
jgi:hypothetical protein